MTATLQAPAAGPPSPLRSSPFRWLLAGRTIIHLGSAIAPVALALAVLHLGGTATELGIVVATFALLDVVTTLFAGVLGDRISRTLIMRGSAAAAALSQAVVAVALINEWATIPLLAAMSGVNGALTAIANPSAKAVIPQTVPEAALPSAVSMLRLSQNSSTLIGFTAAGMLVAAFGPGWAIIVDAATFAIAAVCFGAMRVTKHVAAEPQALLADLRGGFAEVFKHTWLWLLIGQALIYHLFYGGVQGVLGPIVVIDDFGEAAWGWSLAALMAGFMVGAVVTMRYRPRRLLYSGVLFLSLTACFPLAMALPVGMYVVFLGAFLHGFGLEIFSVNWDLAIQQNIPADKLARVFSVDQVGSFVMRPLGLALTGPVAAVAGVQNWLVVTAVVMIVATIGPVLASSVRNLERTA